MHPLEANLNEMNETEVREAIVFPFLQRLGYGIAGPVRVRMELPLKYSLGRKKQKDPTLRGFCDYVCEVVSYGRWVVEAKGGGETLTTVDAEQAHTYTHHPAVGGFFYLVTNGGLFRLYDRDPTKPILEWTLGQMEAIWSQIENLLGPNAIRRRAQVYQIDTGKPLAQGLGSTARIVGGFLTYDEHHSPNPQALEILNKIKGLRATFTDGNVSRTDTGLIRAWLEILGPYKEWDDLNKAAGILGYQFDSAVEFISTDPDSPTIFQGVTYGKLNRGQSTRFPGQDAQRLPMSLNMTAYMEAVGFLEDERFKGTFRISYDYTVNRDLPPDLSLVEGPGRVAIDQALRIHPRPVVQAMFEQLLPGIIAAMAVTTEGTFEMVLK